jgi:hypothetical protein
MVYNKTATVDGHSIFYREAGSPDSAKVVLLHGFSCIFASVSQLDSSSSRSIPCDCAGLPWFWQ